MAKKSFAWDLEENTIRGSFINFVITILYIILIIVSVLEKEIAKNVREIETFLIGFFVTSFGVWTGKKSIEFWKTKSVQQVIQKHTVTEGTTIGNGKSDPKQDQHTINSQND